ncbi:MAG: sigma-70 family RNA polymerase sigma factor [Bryobacteraceae bacterium]|jgi:RNA polymerase sigma-70 factor (ECF subfamily)
MSSRLSDLIVLPIEASPAADDPGNRRVKLEQEVTALFDRFRGPLLRYLWSCGLTLPDGEEVLQEVFLSLFRHLDRGRSLDNVRGWLFRVAHNLALRQRQRRQRDTAASAGAGIGESAVDPAPSPEDRMATSQTQRRLVSVVEALPEQDRYCLFLRADGLTYREIAEILGMSLGAVSLSLARSLARIARSAESSGL